MMNANTKTSYDNDDSSYNRQHLRENSSERIGEADRKYIEMSVENGHNETNAFVDRQRQLINSEVNLSYSTQALPRHRIQGQLISNVVVATLHFSSKTVIEYTTKTKK